ncbi:di-heme oxidoredictase family protein [Aliikangiella maris]|uniref:Di-heme oxidoredictase family protein n=2 Tax=Aliikangiella maris TaxID=3162458 RepID=A0ABV2BYP9_9GAMM
MPVLDQLVKVIFILAIGWSGWVCFSAQTFWHDGADLSQHNLEKKAEKNSNNKPRPNAAQESSYIQSNTAVPRYRNNTFIQPAVKLDLKAQMPFWVGLSFFRDPWVVAPATTTARDGLGPLFNARSCITCHINGGRGALPDETSDLPVALVLKLGPEQGDEQIGNIGDPVYGRQLQLRSIHRQIAKGIAPEPTLTANEQTYHLAELSDKKVLLAEGRVKRICDIKSGHFADGEAYSLCSPSYQVSHLSYGEMKSSTQISPRLAPPLIGMGLLQQISAQQILKRQDLLDQNQDGISGKANWVRSIKHDELALGRFGFKAAQPSVAQQTAAAFNHDMGITSSLYPQEECTNQQTGCQMQKHRELLASKNSILDIADDLLQQVVFFTENLRVPPLRNQQRKQFKQGQQLFRQMQCEACHVASYQLADGQVIYPYTDLLLHDMGDALADNQGEYLATGREWRTPPLWGLGLQQRITGQNAFLHDGRARSLSEAILWHGGEALNARNQFIRSQKSQRDALLYFLNSI